MGVGLVPGRTAKENIYITAGNLLIGRRKKKKLWRQISRRGPCALPHGCGQYSVQKTRLSPFVGLIEKLSVGLSDGDNKFPPPLTTKMWASPSPGEGKEGHKLSKSGQTLVMPSKIPKSSTLQNVSKIKLKIFFFSLLFSQ